MARTRSQARLGSSFARERPVNPRGVVTLPSRFSAENRAGDRAIEPGTGGAEERRSEGGRGNRLEQRHGRAILDTVLGMEDAQQASGPKEPDKLANGGVKAFERV